jgi:hypothetical protein
MKTIVINKIEASPLLRGAKYLTAHGFRVFPLHHADAFGACSCGKPVCKIAKHPRISGWQTKATTKSSQIEKWWRLWPEANIGLVTGDGLIVVDLDGPEAEAYAEERGLPSTASVKTSRGWHLYYAGDGPCRVGIGPGVDVRGNGGYVVAPPSVHKTGAEYTWINALETTLAEVPAWVLDKSGTPSVSRPPRSATPTRVRSKGRSWQFDEGERNDGLFRLGSAMRGMGMSEDEIGAALDVANHERCMPPLADKEIESIVAGVSCYPCGRLIDKTLLSLKLGSYATTVYLALRTSCDSNGECRRSFPSLSSQTGMARTTVIKAVKDLTHAGFIRQTRQPYKCNLYKLLDPPDITV